MRRPLPALALLLAALALPLASGCDDGPVTRADAGPLPDMYEVVFDTTAGEVVAEVHPEWSPFGARRFGELVEAGFYDDVTFFRVVPGFVVQWGLSGDPAANSRWVGSTIPDDPVIESNVRGMMTFAKTGAPDSRSTQLFINYGDNSFLDSMGFSPFARITSGMEVVDAINAEYAEAPDQSRIRAEGEAYLGANFPNLDRIRSARVR